MRVRGDGLSSTSRLLISKKMLEASHVEMPPAMERDLRSFFAEETASRPSTISRLSSCPDEDTLRAANGRLARFHQFRRHHRPIRDRFLVPFRPRTLTRLLKELANLDMLIVDRRLGIDRDELENDGKRFVFLDHSTDELVVAFKRIF